MKTPSQSAWRWYNYTIPSLRLPNLHCLNPPAQHFSLISASWEKKKRSIIIEFRQPPKHDRDRTKIPCKTGRTCLQSLAKKKFCRSDVENRNRNKRGESSTSHARARHHAFVEGGSFQKYENLSMWGWGRSFERSTKDQCPLVRVTALVLRLGQYGRQRAQRERGPRFSPSVSLPLSISILSFPRSLLRHRRTWSNRFLRPFFVARVYRAAFCCRCRYWLGTLLARGEVSTFRKIQRIALTREREHASLSFG